MSPSSCYPVWVHSLHHQRRNVFDTVKTSNIIPNTLIISLSKANAQWNKKHSVRISEEARKCSNFGISTKEDKHLTWEFTERKVFVVAPCMLIVLGPLFVQLMHTNYYKNVKRLKSFKIIIVAPTCFGLHKPSSGCSQPVLRWSYNVDFGCIIVIWTCSHNTDNFK